MGGSDFEAYPGAEDESDGDAVISSSVELSQFWVSDVRGMDSHTKELLDQLVKVWRQKRPRNVLRTSYVEGKNRLKDLGIAIPPQLRDVETVIGWPEKVVRVPSRRCVFDKFVLPSSSEDPFELRSLLNENWFGVEVAQATRSAFTHSVSFMSSTPGRRDMGEPEVLILGHPAEWSAALWDRTRRGLRAAFLVNEVDALGRPVEFTVFTPEESVVCVKGASWYVQDVVPHSLGRTPIEALPYQPDLTRPFGRSRVSRAVMSITDSAVRTALRGEVTAEFYSAPQRYVLGADEEAFFDEAGNPIPAWQAVIGRMLAIGRDENGDLPQVGQFPQLSQQPHTEQMRELAARLAAEGDLSLDDLGIVQDNPSSAQAIDSTRQSLIDEVEEANRVFEAALSRIGQNAVMIRDGLSEVTPELVSLQAKFRPAATATASSRADAVTKLTGAFPWLSDSVVALEEIGWDDEKIQRALSDKQRYDARAFAQSIRSLGGANASLGSGSTQGSVAGDNGGGEL
ncbi:phage portal protein [Microbacterium sp. ZXX196]|uniref:phage portal protein n=1 Tax=Microbacterium sp. ZXX196 TaxID=2609291 RepID=UPI0012B7E1F4|nr:phage portal protein [Microbacterium sp. ZXX196]MTE24837.1 phage portal protein [Microbacterium sp. ZXX196]